MNLRCKIGLHKWREIVSFQTGLPTMTGLSVSMTDARVEKKVGMLLVQIQQCWRCERERRVTVRDWTYKWD